MQVDGLFAKIVAHFSVLFPALIVMWGVAPICTKYTCLLDNVIFKDQDTIAEVYHGMSLVSTVRYGTVRYSTVQYSTH